MNQRNVHVLPRWFEWWQDHVVLSLLIIAGMILNGLMFAHGIVSNIEDPSSWGVFHGIIFGAFFAAGSGLTGVALRASATMGRAFREGRWGIALTNLLVSLIFLPLEFWASVTERSLTHVFTPADEWVLQLLGHPDMPVSPTIVAIAMASPLILFSWGIVTSPPEITTAEDITADAERERAKIEADILLEPLRAQLRAQQVKGARSVAAAAIGRERPMTPAVPTPGTPSDTPPDTQVLQHPADARFNTLAVEDAAADTNGDEPPENDPSPPRGKRRPSAESKGDEAMRWNVGTQPTNTTGAAARVAPPATPANAPHTPPKRTRKPPTKQEPKRANAGRSQLETEELREARMAAARTILAQDPDISIRPFTRRIAMMTHVPIDLHTAYTILVELTGRKPKSKTAEAAERAKAAAEANS